MTALGGLALHSLIASRGRASVASRPPSLAWLDVVTIAAAAVLLALAVLPFAAWGFTDDDIFVNNYLAGKAFPLPMWFGVGRFFPLGEQEWRLVYWWTANVRAYHAVALAQYVVFAVAIALTLKESGRFHRLVYVAIVLAAPVLIAFGNLVMPERSQLMFVALWLWLYQRWATTGDKANLYGCLMCANTVLYLKEPTCVFMATIGGLGLVADWRRPSGTTGGERRSATLDAALVASSLVYVALYLVGTRTSVLVNGQAYSGAVISWTNIAPTLMRLVDRDPVLLSLVVAGTPIAIVVAHRSGLDLWVRLFAGAVGYLAVLLVVGLSSTYFTALPVTAAGIGVWGMIATLPRARRVALVACVPIIAANVLFAAMHFVYRHDWLARNATVVTWLARDGSAPARVFVEEGDRWDVCMLALYATRIHPVGVTFEMPTRDFSCAPASDAFQYVPAAGAGEPTLRLGTLVSERRASIFRGGRLVDSYQDSYARVIRPLAGPLVDRVLRTHYNQW